MHAVHKRLLHSTAGPCQSEDSRTHCMPVHSHLLFLFVPPPGLPPPRFEGGGGSLKVDSVCGARAEKEEGGGTALRVDVEDKEALEAALKLDL